MNECTYSYSPYTVHRGPEGWEVRLDERVIGIVVLKNGMYTGKVDGCDTPLRWTQSEVISDIVKTHRQNHDVKYLRERVQSLKSHALQQDKVIRGLVNQMVEMEEELYQGKVERENLQARNRRQDIIVLALAMMFIALTIVGMIVAANL